MLTATLRIYSEDDEKYSGTNMKNNKALWVTVVGRSLAVITKAAGWPWLCYSATNMRIICIIMQSIVRLFKHTTTQSHGGSTATLHQKLGYERPRTVWDVTVTRASRLDNVPRLCDVLVNRATESVGAIFYYFILWLTSAEDLCSRGRSNFITVQC